jgi:hypothetical protein
MPIRLDDLIADKRDLPVPLRTYGDVTVSYRPNVITAAFRAELRAQTDTLATEEYLAKFLTHVLTGWDLLDAKGKPIPIAEGLAKLPDWALSDLVEAVTSDMAPNAASVSPSKNGSAPTAA